MFRLRIEVELQLAYRIAAIGEKGDLLIHLHALGFEYLKHAPFRLGIVAMYEGKTLGGALGGDTFAGNHLKPPVFAGGLITRMHVASIEAHSERSVGTRERRPI